ncbi:ras-related protein rab-37 [Anaeramoeba flamelloides]|uniref:Ras-related protein rab-37 n=1 Tax=Anaeramoeba flamelloides TaxID=1746091 RepID=A0ABQ8XJQ1_9EUKA|nr:ras-related protein rab-37 [Anaeramoeba flamelloides]
MSDLKIVLLGITGAGKTCLVKRIVDGTFDDKEPTTLGASFIQKKYTCKTGTQYSFAIWDTAGQEKFESLSTFYTRDAGAAIIVYDITSKSSFDSLKRMYKKLDFASEDCFSILVGSKYDLVENDPNSRKVSVESGEKFAKENNSSFFECSSKTGFKVDDIWEEIGQLFIKLLANRNKVAKSNSKPKIKIDQPETDEDVIEQDQKEEGCC